MNLELEKTIISMLQQTDFDKLAFPLEVLVKANHQQNLNDDKAKLNDNLEENQGNQNAHHGNEENQPENKEEGKEKTEPKATETPPESAIESPNGLQQTPDNVEHINVLTEAQLLLIGGHTANLIYRDNGLDYLQQSVPRDLNIENEFSPFIPRFFQLVKPAEITAPSEGPCCIDPIPITVTTPKCDECSCSGSSEFSAATELYRYGSGCIDGTTLSTILNNSFKFTFEGFCDDDTSLILFKQVGGGAYISECGDVTPITDNPSIGESFTIEIIPPSSDCYSCCKPLNCDNPITEINIDLTYWSGYPITIGCINFFQDSDVEFLDKCGNEWLLINNKKNFQLICANEIENAPVVFDLHNKGFELTSPDASNVMLNLTKGYSGYSAHVGWVGPDNGILTYGYSGSGPIANDNFILTNNVPGAKTDLQALQSLAGQNSGIIDHSNAIWDKLGMWVDGNQNGKMDTGEYQTLGQLGITGINLTQIGGPSQINGNLIHSVISFNYADGTTGKAADVTLKLEDIVQNNQSVVELNPNASQATTATTVVASSTPTTPAPVAPTHVDPTVQSAIDPTTTQQHAA